MHRPPLNNSVPGNAIYEPFSGSRTRLTPAEVTRHRRLVMEIEQAYCDVAVRR